jgi:hypothetical protein
MDHDDSEAGKHAALLPGTDLGRDESETYQMMTRTVRYEGGTYAMKDGRTL